MDKPNPDNIDLIEDETIARKSCKYKAKLYYDLIASNKQSPLAIWQLLHLLVLSSILPLDGLANPTHTRA